MNQVFIACLPRSKSGWFANFLTYGNAFVMHDGFHGVNTLDEFYTKMEGSDGLREIRGNSDPANLLFWNQLHDHYPNAKWVVVKRNSEDAFKSSRRSFPGLTRLAFVKMEQRLLDLIEAIHPLVVQFDKIDATVANHVADYCGIDWYSERTDMLLKMNVQIDPVYLRDSLSKGIKHTPQFLKESLA